uniref:Uncharacterized protein n=1 Tax=Natrinema halophilum TaxID=1699371 RepID=A0A7D5GF55_9EURY
MDSPDIYDVLETVSADMQSLDGATEAKTSIAMGYLRRPYAFDSRLTSLVVCSRLTSLAVCSRLTSLAVCSPNTESGSDGDRI